MNFLILLSTIALGCGSIAAQCVPPSPIPHPPTRGVSTPFYGTTFLACPTPPNYCSSLDPGTGLRFDLHTSVDIGITEIGTNFLNDGGTYAGIVVPNLVGTVNGTCEVWIAPGRSVTDPTLYQGSSYAHIPPSPPPPPWTLLSSSATHLNNLVFAIPDVPSLATFTPPLQVAAGSYAVMLVLVPRGVATIPPGQGSPADPLTGRIHALYTNLNSFPSPASLADGTITLSNIGIQETAFTSAALSSTSVPPYLPNLTFTYEQSPRVPWDYAYSTAHGLGCNATSQTFLESWSDGVMDIDGAGAANGLDMFVVDESLNTGRFGDGYYWVTLNSTPGLWISPGSSIGARRLNALPAPVGQSWDDAIIPVGLPFAFPHPANIRPGSTAIWVSTNGIVYLEDPMRSLASTAPRAGFSGDHSAFFLGPTALAAAWSDYMVLSPSTASGEIWYDTDGASFACVTWLNCAEQGQSIQLSTVQMVIDAGGHVRIRFGNGGIQTVSHPVLTGYSAGKGPDIRSNAGGPRAEPDFSVACLPGGFRSPRRTSAAAAIYVESAPIVNQPMTLATVIDYPSSVLNVTLLSTASLSPGIDLWTLGMPGCVALIQLPEIASFLSSNIAGRARWPVVAALPAFLLGTNLHAQSVQLCINDSSINAAGLLASNALCIHVGNY